MSGNGAQHDNHPELHCSNLFNLDGRIAVVTGGSSGLGSMIARTLVSNGARVYLVGRHVESLQRVCKEFEAMDKGRCSSEAKIIPIPADLSTKDGVEKMKKEVEKREKSIDLLINAAKMQGQSIHPSGGNSLQSISQALLQQGQREAEDILRTNVIGTYFVIATLLPLLGNSSHNPQIINLAGVSGLSRETSQGLIEPASQSAVIHMSKTLSTLLARTNVRCNVIAPGIFPGGEKNQNEKDPKSMSYMKEMMTKVPVGRPGGEKDMSTLILCLCSDFQSYVSGAVIPIDGGLLTQVPCCY
ncbi:hypothetical protein DFH28DRAFT_1079205 [Melampsora americana]|nr:hypothetical protein DFH28DRAFT_1079205 [Melampsora americana]